ncbi:MAG: hypothetical protein IKU32_08135 [Clostridia bacterium]|nr:hypothetical protein [Clostridia bacterium]
MKNILFIISASILLLTGCSAPTEQIVVTIAAENTPEPAITPVLTSAPSDTAAAESASSPSAIPESAATAMPIPKATVSPTAAPTAAPTVQPTASPTIAPTAQPTPEPAAEPTPTPAVKPEKISSSSDFGGSVLTLVNSCRSSAGLSSLKYSSAMQKAADTRAKECVSSFSHTRPDGSKAYTALTERGVSFTAFGENIFAASGMSSVSAEYVMEQWMASQGHRENILRDGFTHMCIGVASHGDEIFVVQLFGAGIS